MYRNIEVYGNEDYNSSEEIKYDSNSLILMPKQIKRLTHGELIREEIKIYLSYTF